MYVCLYGLYGTARKESLSASARRVGILCVLLTRRDRRQQRQPSLKEIEGHARSPQPKGKVWKVDTPRGEIVRALRERKKARKRWGGIS